MLPLRLEVRPCAPPPRLLAHTLAAIRSADVALRLWPVDQPRPHPAARTGTAPSDARRWRTAFASALKS
eukprot:5619390-Prymnesium_polylepis.1